MRVQYSFWPAETGSGLDAWNVHQLIDAVADAPIVEVALDDIPAIDSEYWFDAQMHRPTVRSIVEHMRLVNDVDESYPIILGPQNRVMDGMHRIARAMLHGRTSIRAVRLDPLPAPDHRNCRPQDLSYD